MAPTPGLDGWVLLLVSIGTSTTVGGIINAYVSRRKTSADVNEAMARTGKTEAEITGVGASTAAAQVDTSLRMLQEMRADMAILRSDLMDARKDATDARTEANRTRAMIDDAQRDLADLQRWNKAHAELMELHAQWDAQVVHVVRQLGGNIDPPPPLFPDVGSV